MWVGVEQHRAEAALGDQEREVPADGGCAGREAGGCSQGQSIQRGGRRRQPGRREAEGPHVNTA